METVKGQVVSVTRGLAGSNLIVDAVATDTELFLDDVSDFDEEGGSVTVEGVVLTYLSVDQEAASITLSAGLAGGLSAYVTFVAIYPDAPTHTAEALLTDDSGVTVSALVPQNLRALLHEGIREPEAREAVTLMNNGDDWMVLDIEWQAGTHDASTVPIIVTTDDGESVRIDGDGISTYTNDPVPVRTIPGSSSSVASDGTNVFVGDLVSVTCFEIATGDQLWQIAVGVTDLAYESGFVYVATASGGDIRKFNSTTGVENLSGFPISASAYAYLAVNSGFIYARETSTGDIRKFDSTTGVENVSGFPVVGTFSDLAVSGGFIYVDSAATSVKKIDATTGVEDTGGDFPISGNFAAVGAYGGFVYVCDLASDTVRKFIDTDGTEVVTGGFPIAVEFDANYWSMAVNAAVICAVDTHLNVRIFNNAEGYESTRRDSSDGTDRAHALTVSDLNAFGDTVLSGRTTADYLAVTYTKATRSQAIANNTTVTLTAFDSFTGSGTGGTTAFWSYSAGVFTILVPGLYRIKCYGDWPTDTDGYRLINFHTALTSVRAADANVTRHMGDDTLFLAAGTALSTSVRHTAGASLTPNAITVSIQRLGSLAP